MAKEKVEIEFNGKRYPVLDGVTPEKMLESLSGAVPELANAKLEKKSDNLFLAVVSHGTKG